MANYKCEVCGTADGVGHFPRVGNGIMMLGFKSIRDDPKHVLILDVEASKQNGCTFRLPIQKSLLVYNKKQIDGWSDLCVDHA